MHQALASTVADAPPIRDWPNGLDLAMLALYLALALGLPLFAYVLMFLDYRHYLRSLRRTLVSVAQAMPGTPYWVYRDRPPCLESLDLHLPCSEDEVLAAYRLRVKSLHPDHGGDLQEFLRLQEHFEQAMHLAQSSGS